MDDGAKAHVALAHQDPSPLDAAGKQQGAPPPATKLDPLAALRFLGAARTWNPMYGLPRRTSTSSGGGGGMGPPATAVAIATVSGAAAGGALVGPLTANRPVFGAAAAAAGPQQSDSGSLTSTRIMQQQQQQQQQHLSKGGWERQPVPSRAAAGAALELPDAQAPHVGSAAGASAAGSVAPEDWQHIMAALYPGEGAAGRAPASAQQTTAGGGQPPLGAAPPEGRPSLSSLGSLDSAALPMVGGTGGGGRSAAWSGSQQPLSSQQSSGSRHLLARQAGQAPLPSSSSLQRSGASGSVVGVAAAAAAAPAAAEAAAQGEARGGSAAGGLGHMLAALRGRQSARARMTPSSGSGSAAGSAAAPPLPAPAPAPPRASLSSTAGGARAALAATAAAAMGRFGLGAGRGGAGNVASGGGSGGGSSAWTASTGGGSVVSGSSSAGGGLAARAALPHGPALTKDAAAAAAVPVAPLPAAGGGAWSSLLGAGRRRQGSARATAGAVVGGDATKAQEGDDGVTAVVAPVSPAVLPRRAVTLTHGGVPAPAPASLQHSSVAGHGAASLGGSQQQRGAPAGSAAGAAPVAVAATNASWAELARMAGGGVSLEDIRAGGGKRIVLVPAAPGGPDGDAAQATAGRRVLSASFGSPGAASRIPRSPSATTGPQPLLGTSPSRAAAAGLGAGFSPPPARTGAWGLDGPTSSPSAAAGGRRA